MLYVGIQINIVQDIATIPALNWDACASAQGPFDPFTAHGFLLALEQSKSVGGGTGWQPYHLVAEQNGETLGVMPLYAKGIRKVKYFDHAWAGAYAEAGGQYYPKLLNAVPFTPATGHRLLAKTDMVKTALIKGAIQLTGDNGLSSFHINFCTRDEYALARPLD